MLFPSWLPAMLVLDPIWEKNLTRLFNVFKNDFILNHPFLGIYPVWYDKSSDDGIYPKGFYHLIEREEILEKYHNLRTPDRLRAERLPWCAPSIINSDDSIVKKWEILEKGEICTYVWLESLDYVVVLAKRVLRIGEIRFLKTAFHVDGDSTRKKLIAKYANRITP